MQCIRGTATININAIFGERKATNIAEKSKSNPTIPILLLIFLNHAGAASGKHKFFTSRYMYMPAIKQFIKAILPARIATARECEGYSLTKAVEKGSVAIDPANKKFNTVNVLSA